MTSVTSTDFSGIWGTSNTNVFAVSTGTITSTAGTIFHYNGNYLTATTITSYNTFSSIYDIWGSPEGDVFAASDQGILRCANCQQPVQEYLPATFFS
ncbi:hypothetical protein THII_2668 [Thioploca ingrica]|uniref:Uncharacterized protein n=1 Tax=Thioploca ingrica TaxID=40754 RepID=A0A090ANJ6_9GAMM|nr:hypothetical protein THII_2668 [Thioploca ingrica]